MCLSPFSRSPLFFSPHLSLFSSLLINFPLVCRKSVSEDGCVWHPPFPLCLLSSCLPSHVFPSFSLSIYSFFPFSPLSSVSERRTCAPPFPLTLSISPHFASPRLSYSMSSSPYYSEFPLRPFGNSQIIFVHPTFHFPSLLHPPVFFPLVYRVSFSPQTLQYRNFPL